MKKEIVLAKLKEYAGRSIEIGLADEGAMLYAGIEGHWLFTEGDNLIEVRKNVSDGTHGFSAAAQQTKPFAITVINFDTINYVRTMATNDPADIESLIAGLTPVGTDDTFEDIKNAIQSDSIFKAHSPRGYSNDPNIGFDGLCGPFKGTMITTNKDGLPIYTNDLVNRAVTSTQKSTSDQK